MLPAFAGLGSVALVTDAASGHAARLAAEAVNAVTALVTLGTPAGPVSFTVLDTTPMAEALRVLAALLPALDPAEPDDLDLARGRSLVKALTDLLPLGDPGVELRPPAVLPGAPRAGLAVHNVFGTMRPAAVEAAITAIFAAGMSLRALSRADAIIGGGITGAGIGVMLPISIRADGFAIDGQAMVEALGFELAGGVPSIRATNVLRVQLSFAREPGWLIGGPDPARGPGPRPEHELRRLEATLVLPLRADAEASAEIVLIEPKVFGIGRDRWVVSAAGMASTAAEIVTPALPEVRVLLAQFAAQLTAATAPAIASLRQLLAGLGLLDASGGWVADGIDHLLNEPLVRVGDALADAARRAELQAGVTALVGAIPGLGIDLATRTLTLALSGTPGTFGMKPWSLLLAVAPGVAPQFDFTLEAGADGPEGGLAVNLHAPPFALTLQRHHPGLAAPEAIPVWPNPDAQRLLAAITRLAPAELARHGLEYLRDLDETVRPIVDAAYDALGLLGPADIEEARGVRLPLALIEDPLGWLGHAGALGGSGGFDATKIIAFLDAFKPILGVTGGPGEWNLANGFVLRADSLSGTARLGLQIDSSGFAPVPAASGRLTLSGSVALSLPAGLPPRPVVAVAVGISGAAPGRRAVHLVSDNGLQIFLRPDSGPDLPLYPNPPGLANLAQAAVAQALPLILDALADQTGAGLPGNVGAAVRTLGDALALRNGAPAHFDGAALQAFAADPAAAFAARLPVLSNTIVTALATALGPLLPAPATVTMVSGKLTATINGVSIWLQPSPFEVKIATDLDGLPAIRHLDLAVTLSGSGLTALELAVGPADIDAGGISLRPTLVIAAGSAPTGGRRIQLGLALDDAGDRNVAARWLLDPTSFSLIATDGASVLTDAADVALALIDAVVQLVASFAIATPAVDQLLDKTLPNSGGTQVREILRGVFLQNVPNPSALDANLFDPDSSASAACRSCRQPGRGRAHDRRRWRAPHRVGAERRDRAADAGRDRARAAHQGDVVVSVEADSRWIKEPADRRRGARFPRQERLAFTPSLAVNGLGIRVSRSSGPLLDVGVYAGLHRAPPVRPGRRRRTPCGWRAGATERPGDEPLARPGRQPVARGLTTDGGASGRGAAVQPGACGAEAWRPGRCSCRCAPARATDPGGSSIQKGFGPIYIEQVGFGVTVRKTSSQKISILLDGRVSISGLTAAVDDLTVTFVVASDASLFDPSRLGARSGRPRRQRRHGRRRAGRRAAQVRQRRERRICRHAAGAVRRLRPVGLRRLRQRGGERPAVRAPSSRSARSTGRSAGRRPSSSPASAAASASTAT